MNHIIPVMGPGDFYYILKCKHIKRGFQKKKLN